MSQASARTYDDLPEADVATVLEVPLLWGGAVSAPPRRPRDASVRRGAHAAPGAPIGRSLRPVLGAAAGRHRAAASPRPSHRRSFAWRHHPLAHTLEVGLISATLVLGVVGAVLLALAAWLP